MYQTYSIGHSKEGFKLNLFKASRLRESVAYSLDALNHFVFGWMKILHVPEYHICNSLHTWAWRAEKEIGSLPITKEQAMAWTQHPDAWSWLDDEEEE